MSFLLWGQPKSSFPSSLSSKASVVFLVDFMNYVVWSLNFCLMSPEKVNGLLGAWFSGGFVSLVLFDLFSSLVLRSALILAHVYLLVLFFLEQYF